MISIKLRDFRGCERAEISCGISLVAGRNGAGKSSLAQATAAALTGEVLPIAGRSKASAGELIKTGASAAFVEIRHETGTNRIDWPACQATAQGQPPHASPWAAGLRSIALLSGKERSQILSEYLHAAPTREDLAQALGDVELGDARVTEAIWQLIEAHGWDGAHQLRRDIGAELKGRWRQVTGANYGSRIAASWRPPDWSDELAGATEVDLDDAITRTKTAHEEAIAASAVAGAERERLSAAAAEVENLKDALAAAEIEEARLEEAAEAAKEARAALPEASGNAAMPCPHCGQGIILRRIGRGPEHRLEKAQQLPAAAELKQQRLAIADADGTVSRANAELTAQARAVETARYALHIALDARAALAKLPQQGAPGPDVAAAGRAHEDATRRLRAFRQQRDADDLYRKITGNDLVLDILNADGLRARKLARVLEVFNSTQLAPLCEAAGWRAIGLQPDMTLDYGGRPYVLTSTSEQYRVRAVLQLAMARLDGSDMVVLDAADVLDGTTRSGLFAMLDEVGLPALVCMTLSRREQVPDLAEAGLGASYWLEGGIAKPLHALQEAAA